MSYLPFSSAFMNVVDNTYFPSTVKSRNNRSYAYWERSLFHRALSVFKSELPKDWENEEGVTEFFWFCLFKFGFVAVFEDAKYGLTFQPCTLYGRNFYYQPTEAVIANPDLEKRLIIGKQCELIRLTPDRMGAWDCIDYAAEKLSHMDNAVNMSLINNKYAFFLAARNKAMAAALNKVMDLVNRGEPAVVVNSKLINDQTDKEEPWQFWERDLKKNYITTDQLMDQQTILNNFDTEIGIPTVPYQKKERMVTSEAESKQVDATARSTVWVEELNKSAERVNKMFGTDINFELRFDPEKMEGGEDNAGTTERDRDREVL